MALTGLVLVGFVAPSILDGHGPLLVAVVAASTIAFAGFYLTHGPAPETTIALAGTLGSLGLTLGISALFFGAARFTGVATEEGAILSFVSGGIDLSSLLLAGAMIGALGALDDVTITQAATVAELRPGRSDPPGGPADRRGPARRPGAHRLHDQHPAAGLRGRGDAVAAAVRRLRSVLGHGRQLRVDRRGDRPHTLRIHGPGGRRAAHHRPGGGSGRRSPGGARGGGRHTSPTGVAPSRARIGRRRPERSEPPASWDDFTPREDLDF